MTTCEFDSASPKKWSPPMGLIAIATCLTLSAICARWVDPHVFSIQTLHQSVWLGNSFVLAITLLGKTWIPLWLICLWSFKQCRWQPILTAGLALLLTIPIVIPTKQLVGRPRPREIINAEQDQRDSTTLRGKSLPSGDTAAAFAIATALGAFTQRRWTIVLWLTAGLVGVLRVTSMAHYPSDVLVGAAIGIGAGWLSCMMNQRWVDPESVNPLHYRRLAFGAVILLPGLMWIFTTQSHFTVFVQFYGTGTALIWGINRLKSRTTGTRPC